MQDPRATRFIVATFRTESGDELQPIEIRPASACVGAVRVAHSMLEQWRAERDSAQRRAQPGDPFLSMVGETEAGLPHDGRGWMGNAP